MLMMVVVVMVVIVVMVVVVMVVVVMVVVVVLVIVVNDAQRTKQLDNVAQQTRNESEGKKYVQRKRRPRPI
jgi:flagellar basal body-associated protein FliL